MRVLLTGGSGFIGRSIAARLRSKHVIHAPTHDQLDLIDHAAVRRWMARNPVDCVVHAAVKPGHRNAADTTKLLESNLRQFFSLQACRDAFGRFVVITSGAVYGAQRPLMRIVEDEFGDVVPDDESGFSKYIEAMWLANDREAVELRPFGVYGPGEDYAIRFISNACCKALFGMPITVRRNRIFSYVWVDDLATIVERALGGAPGSLPPGAYNVTPGEPVSLQGLADLVVRASGRNVPIVVAEGGLGSEYSGAGGKLEACLPDFRAFSFGEGVETLLEWYASRLGTIDRSVLEVDK